MTTIPFRAIFGIINVRNYTQATPMKSKQKSRWQNCDKVLGRNQASVVEALPPVARSLLRVCRQQECGEAVTGRGFAPSGNNGDCSEGLGSGPRAVSGSPESWCCRWCPGSVMAGMREELKSTIMDVRMIRARGRGTQSTDLGLGSITINCKSAALSEGRDARRSWKT